MANNRLTTGKGIAMYAYLQNPDTHFVSEGVYTLQLLLNPNEQSTISLIDSLKGILKTYIETDDRAKNAIEQAKKSKKTIEYIPLYGENDSGDYVFKFKQKARSVSKSGVEYNFKVKVVDSQKMPMTEEVGNGSKVRVCFTANPYVMMGRTLTIGLSLRPVAVQVIELRDRTSGGDDFGFDCEESGFTSSGSSGLDMDCPF